MVVSAHPRSVTPRLSLPSLVPSPHCHPPWAPGRTHFAPYPSLPPKACPSAPPKRNRPECSPPKTVMIIRSLPYPPIPHRTCADPLPPKPACRARTDSSQRTRFPAQHPPRLDADRHPPGALLPAQTQTDPCRTSPIHPPTLLCLPHSPAVHASCPRPSPTQGAQPGAGCCNKLALLLLPSPADFFPTFEPPFEPTATRHCTLCVFAARRPSLRPHPSTPPWAANTALRCISHPLSLFHGVK